MPDQLPLLIEPSELFAKLGTSNLLIIDLGSAPQYDAGHVPGAVRVIPQEMVCGKPPAPGKLADIAQLNQLFSRIGLTPDTHVVCYDDEGGGWAGRFIWTLDVIGHKKYSYLNGGIHAWRGEGLPTETTPNIPAPSKVSVNINTSPIAEAEDILANLDDPNFVIWDARTPEEYEGTKILAHRGGHIPGAINCEWTNLMDHSRSLRIRKDATDILEGLGLTPNKTIVTHCQSHHRSGFTYLVAKILGYPHIRGYHGSWSEWGNRYDTPVEQ